MPNLKNYTTRVPASKTAFQIAELLAKHGASQVTQEYEGTFGHANVVGVSWVMQTPYGEVSFRLPVNVDKCHVVLMKQKAMRSRDPGVAYEHSRNVAWRIVKNWVEVQLALLDTEMATLDQIMLPYVVGRDGRTLYQHMLDGGYSQFALPSSDD